MKMKGKKTILGGKTLAGGLLALFLLLSLATAVMAGPSMPHPVYGKIVVLDHVMPLSEVKLSVCDYRLSTVDNCVVKGEVFEDLTDVKGYYMFELANLYPLWREGDLIKIEACTGNVACKQVLELKDTATELNFDINSQVIYIDNNGDVIDIDTGEPVDVPDNTIVVKPMTDAEKEALAVEIAGEVIDTLNLEELNSKSWWKGMLGIVKWLLTIAAALGAGYYVRANKTLRTMLQKQKAGKYKKK